MKTIDGVRITEIDDKYLEDAYKSLEAEFERRKILAAEAENRHSVFEGMCKIKAVEDNIVDIKFTNIRKKYSPNSADDKILPGCIIWFKEGTHFDKW